MENTGKSFIGENSGISVSASRILYTPSAFAKNALLYLQEVGELKALKPHTSARSNLKSFLCFVVLKGTGKLEFMGKTYDLKANDVVFIDCNKPYSHSTGVDGDSYGAGVEECAHGTGNGACGTSTDVDNSALWELKWCHFNSVSLPSIYEKYEERGGAPVFHPENVTKFTKLLTEIYALASSSDYIRDMRINEKLSSLLTLIMEESWHPESAKTCKKRPELAEIRAYLDAHYTEKIALDNLAKKFFINKFYLTKIFKEAYGVTINTYVAERRITAAKSCLRFSDKTIDEIGNAVGMNDANYFSRAFKKIEGISPSEYRKQW